jgi:hypothetical protein
VALFDGEQGREKIAAPCIVNRLRTIERMVALLSASYPVVAFLRTLLLFLVFVAAIVIGVWAIVDAIRTPREAFSAAGSSKALWLTLLLVFAVLAFFVTAVLGVVYFLRIRPRVRAMMDTAS